jgi:hypothetical protein
LLSRKSAKAWSFLKIPPGGRALLTFYSAKLSMLKMLLTYLENLLAWQFVPGKNFWKI